MNFPKGLFRFTPTRDLNENDDKSIIGAEKSDSQAESLAESKLSQLPQQSKQLLQSVDEVQQLQQQRKHEFIGFTRAPGVRLSSRWTKLPKPNDNTDVGDGSRSFTGVSGNFYSHESETSANITTALKSGSKEEKFTSFESMFKVKRPWTAREPLETSVLSPSNINLPEESEDTESDGTAISSQFNEVPKVTEYMTKPQRQISTYSLSDDIFGDNKNMSAIIKRSRSTHSDDSITKNTYCPVEAVDMNFIMLIGLIIGVVISKSLQYLQLFFSWFQKQILQLRYAFIGHANIWDIFNFDDNSTHDLRTKLFLLPMVLACNIVYTIVSFLHFGIRFLLRGAPVGLVTFIQKLNTDAA